MWFAKSGWYHIMIPTKKRERRTPKCLKYDSSPLSQGRARRRCRLQLTAECLPTPLISSTPMPHRSEHTKNAKVIRRALVAGYKPISFLVADLDLDREALEILEQWQEIPVYTAEEAVLRKLTGFAMTRGMLCGMQRKALPAVEDICRDARRIAILENVVNPTNVGAIFRSAAALHMDAVLLTGGCSDPLYRRAARVSMGTVFQIPWTYFDKKTKWPVQGMESLSEMGYKTVAMALRNDSVEIRDPKLKAEEKLAIILGTEGEGLDAETMELCDYTVKIPMSHGVDSLNVAAASAVAFWELGQRS